MSSKRTRKSDEIFCRYCGEPVSVHAEVCPNCGVRNEQYRHSTGRANRSSDDFGRSANTTTGGIGLDANVTAALSYVLGFITGIVVYVLEDDRFARFHAAQSIVVFGALAVANIVIGVFAAIGVASIAALLSGLVSLVALGLWIFLIITAYQGKTSRIPVAADVADSLVSGSGKTNRTPSGGSANTETETDALAALRTRYARGEIGEDEFERRLERLLESEHTERYEPADLERSH